MDTIKLLDRLSKKLLNSRIIDESTDCWLYTGSKDPSGYGQVSFMYKHYNVHRIAAYLWLGLDLRGLDQANHKIECPNKHCFNPEHLYIGTQSQNLNDYYKLSDTGFCPHGHPKRFLYIYTSFDGKTYKWCRECKRIARQKYWNEKGK